MLLDIIAGARPNFMKIAPIIHAIQSIPLSEKNLDYRLIHTGQHYDYNLSESFFEQLDIPPPSINFESGSGTQAEQTADIMVKYESLLHQSPSDLCLVVGDVTSSMACAISAQKSCIPVAHVEGGIRSGDWSMPEEINRLLTDSITNIFFTTSDFANQNLLRSGVSPNRIVFVGNTMIDTLYSSLAKLIKPPLWSELQLQPQRYVLLTLHRPSNVDDHDHLDALLNVISNSTSGYPIVFPVHPRTRNVLSSISSIPSNIHLVDPQPYLQFIYLLKNSISILTDSGGISEEATVLGIPCMTLRNSTERPETVSIGTNYLIGDSLNLLPHLFSLAIDNKWKKSSVPPKWDGRSGSRIAHYLNGNIINLSSGAL